MADVVVARCIGIDYFQVLAMFANSRVQWPTYIKDVFHLLSVFNFNIELTAPECSIPDLGYITKWAFIQGLPAMACLLFFLTSVWSYCKKKLILKRRKGLHSHNSMLISMVFVMFYFIYLSLTRATLEVFNCSPTGTAPCVNVAVCMYW